MSFEALEARMRVYETAHDLCVLPGMYMIARLDGRSFTRLTKEVHPFEAPFDERFRDHMVATTEHLMCAGFRVVYAHTHSDELSLLFHRDETTYGRKTRKYNSVLAGEASARFSLLLGDLAVFDCRISELPSLELVREYFRWRRDDSHRNALSAHCYWLLRSEGRSATEATRALEGATVAEKNELLFQRGINFNDLPAWQKRGVGLFWATVEKTGHNPVTGREESTTRRRLHRDMELPTGEAYLNRISELVLQSEAET